MLNQNQRSKHLNDFNFIKELTATVHFASLNYLEMLYGRILKQFYLIQLLPVLETIAQKPFHIAVAFCHLHKVKFLLLFKKKKPEKS